MESDDEFPMLMRWNIPGQSLPIFVLLNMSVEHSSEPQDMLTVHPLEEVDLRTDRLELVDVLDRVLLLPETIVWRNHQS